MRTITICVLIALVFGIFALMNLTALRLGKKFRSGVRLLFASFFFESIEDDGKPTDQSERGSTPAL